MKSIAADAFLVEVLWQRVAVGNFGVTAMKRSIEAGDLRKLRLSLQQSADGAEIVRLMQRCKRCEGLKPLERDIVDEKRLAEVRTAMHHTMTDRDRQASNLCAQELYHLPQGRGHVAHLPRRPGLVDKDLALRVFGGEARMDADPLHLSFQTALQPIARADGEQLKLDARAAGINDENGLGHGSHVRIG